MSSSQRPLSVRRRVGIRARSAPTARTMRNVCAYVCSFWIYPRCVAADIVEIAIATRIYAVGIGDDDGFCSRRRGAIPPSDAIAAIAAWVTHVALLHFLWYCVERESRELAREPNCETIGRSAGFIIGKARRGILHAREMGRGKGDGDRERSAWKVTREIATTISPSLRGDTDATEVTNAIFSHRAASYRPYLRSRRKLALSWLSENPTAYLVARSAVENYRRLRTLWFTEKSDSDKSTDHEA